MPNPSLRIAYPEVLGVSETSATLCFSVDDGSGPADADAEVVLTDTAGNVRVWPIEGAERSHLVRVTDLEPDTAYRVDVRTRGAEPAERGRHFPDELRTLPAPGSGCVGSFATLNDLHFGEPRMGGVLTADMEYGEAADGFPVIEGNATEVAYSTFMNEDAVEEVNALGVDLAVIKGDIADGGRPEQFEIAAKTFSRFTVPHHAQLGNHDYLGRLEGLDVDGYAALGQEPAPKAVELGGWRLLLLETSVPGEHHGVLGAERHEWLEDALLASHEGRAPTLIIMHHQPVPPEHRESYPNNIGLDPEHSLEMFDLVGRCPAVKGVLIGHTHRNRVRTYAASGAVPYIETHNTKDFPGGYAHYRLFEDGSFRQEMHRTGTERALRHSDQCRGLFDGAYRHFTMGSLAERSLAVSGH